MTGVLSANDRIQQEAASYREGNAYVGAGPGTGKTTLLVQRYVSLRAEGVPASAILVLTFSRRAVQELRDRLALQGTPVGELDVRTFHGFSSRIAGGGQTRFRDGRLLDGFSRALVLEQALAATTTPSLSEAIRASDGFRRDATALLEDLGRAAEIDDLDGASPRVRDLLALLAQLREERRLVGGRDLGDLVGRAVKELAHEQSPASLAIAGYRHVLIDEFQDTDRVQMELLAALARRATLFAVGDEAQSIYRFRGAAHGIVDEAIARFRMRRFALTESRRCPPDVCALASAAPIPDLAPLTSTHADGDAVHVARLRRVDHEVAYVADAVETAIQAGEKPHEIAILVRSFAPVGALLHAELLRRGIAVAATGRAELLADERVAALRAGLELLARPNDGTRWTRFLTSSALGTDPIAVRLAGPAVESLQLDDSLAASLGSCGIAQPIAAHIAAGLLEAQMAWLDDDLGLAARRIVRRLGLLAAALREEPPTSVRGSASRLKRVCDSLAAGQRTARALGVASTPAAMVEQFEDLLPELGLDAGFDADAPGVRLLSVHGAKGLEFDRVIICDAVNGRFPQAPRPSTLLDDADRVWLRAHGVDGASINDAAADEEASLWYVAVTRAKRSLTVTYADEAPNGDRQSPSRFLAGRVPTDLTEVDREPLLLRALRSGDAHLRDELLSTGMLDQAPAAQAFAVDGASAFQPVAHRPVEAKTLGVATVEKWLNCPRSVYYENFLRIEDDGDVSLEKGNMLHLILQRFHEQFTDFRTVPADAIATWESELLRLRAQEWGTAKFATPVIERAAMVSIDALLKSYARELAREASARPFTVDKRESDIEVAIGPHRLRGRVDRIDLDVNGKRTIVDYKSGKAKKKALSAVMGDAVEYWNDPEENQLSYAGVAPSELRAQLVLYASAIPDADAVAYVYLGGVYNPDRRNGATTERTPLDDDAFLTALTADLRAHFLDPLDAGTLTKFARARSEDNCKYCAHVFICKGAEVAP